MPVTKDFSAKKRKSLRILAISSSLVLVMLVSISSIFFYHTHSYLSEVKELVWIAGESGKEILGFQGQKKYLLAFQNSAEARGTGGLIGAYAIINFNHGNITIEKSGSNIDLIHQKTLPIAMPTEYVKLYGNDPAMWLNSNLSPHFPYAAKIWMKLWQLQSGENLDGVIAIDPTVVSYLLKTVGSVQLADGTLVTSDNVVQFTLSDMYQKYETNNLERKRVLVNLLTQVFSKIQNTNALQKMEILKTLLEPYKDNRILFYSSGSKTENVVEKAKLGGAMLLDAPNEFRAVVINIDGNKMDYYLERKIKVQDLTCTPSRITQLTFTVKNTFDGMSRLPDYVWGRLDLGKPQGEGGSHKVKILIYGPTGSKIVFATQENESDFPGGVFQERGRPLFVTSGTLMPKKSEVLQVAFSRKGYNKAVVITQPLVLGTKVQIGKSCKPSGRK